MTARLFLFIIAISVSFSTSYAQSVDVFRQAAREALAAYQVPGFSVGIIKDGKIVMAEGFGTRTQGERQPADANTLYAIASNTKAFVSSSIVKLHLEGKLDLDAPVQQYLPEFQLYDPYVSAHIRVRDLLCHRAGLGTFSGDVVWYKSALPADAVIRQIRHLPQAYEFRAGYGYSNLMFITAGEVIKAVTGQPWDAYVHEQFLLPLGMKRTQTSVTPLAKMDNVATPHISRHNNQPIPYANWDNMGAAGGIVSSAQDMLLWVQAQLQQGQVDDTRIFPESLTETCWRPHTPIGGSKTFNSAGLGWFLQSTDGQRVVSHGGGYDGMYSQVKMLPDQQLGIVILTNGMTGLAGALSTFITDTYMGRDTKDWLTKAVAREAKGTQEWNERQAEREKARTMDTKPTVAETDYTGKYHDPLYGTIEVKMMDGQLHLLFETAPALNATLAHWHYDTWRIVWNEPHAWFDFGTVQFILDNNRRVTELAFDVPNDDIFFEEIHAKRVN